ncbi:MAG: hypothetical protein ABW184_05805 [Sphingobium sp.]
MRRESFSLLRPAAFRGRIVAPAIPARGKCEVPTCPLGIAWADEWLGGGLQGDGLHEFFAGDTQSLPSGLGFALILAMMPGGVRDGGVVWLRRGTAGVPYGPGLVDLGLDPGAITILSLADDRALLRATLDTVRSGAVGAVLLEAVGRQPLLDLTATRRLVVAAAETGTLVLIVRASAEPGLSAAHSRWRVGSAPSRPLAADAPGFPVFDLSLLRLRGGREGLNILLEWNRDTASFREAGAALSGGASAVAGGAERADPHGRAA